MLNFVLLHMAHCRIRPGQSCRSVNEPNARCQHSQTLKNSWYWQLYRELRNCDSSGMESMIVSTSGASITYSTYSTRRQQQQSCEPCPPHV